MTKALNIFKTCCVKVRSRLGDFWWYSLMVFLAARAADCLNVFVGLWLVPKYVPPSELGAVQPLMNFANFLAIPAAVFASTFRNELTTLATKSQFGKMKTLMRSVFITTAIFFFLAIVICHFLLPLFLERIRIVEGSLGLLILVASFIGTAAPVYSNALQSLKKFRDSSIISFLSAPIRFVTMLLMMPFRALSGYFVGQASVPAFTIAASIFSLRKELAVKAEPYWNRTSVKSFARLFLIFGISAAAAGFCTLIESTVIRQRLPEIESAAYYMITRFTEIASFIGISLTFTIFPFAAELNAKGKSHNALVFKAFAAILLTNSVLALFFIFFGKGILTLLPFGNQYAEYAWAIPWIITLVSVNWLVTLYITAESAAMRFSYLKWYVPFHIVYPVLLLLVTGYGYFTSFLSPAFCRFLDSINVTSLSRLFVWMTIFTAAKTAVCLYAMMRRR